MAHRVQACWDNFRLALSETLAARGVQLPPHRRLGQKSSPGQPLPNAEKQEMGANVSFVPFDKKGDPIEPCKVALISQGFRPGTRVASTDGSLRTIVAINGNGSVEIEDGKGKASPWR